MCIEQIIGLSQTVCNCYEDTPSEYNVSDSGLYLDELEGMSLNLAGSASDCEQGGVWDILEKARTNAIQDFKADFIVQVGSLYKKTIENNTYQIGSQKYIGTYTPSTVYAGVRLVPKQVENGKITINTIKYIHSSSGVVVNFSIFNSLSSTALHTFTITTVANQAASSATLNYELPMYVSGEYIEYYIVYEVPATGSPMQNKIVCSSCLKWDLKCCDTPCFGNRSKKDELWNNNLMIGGIKGDDWDDLDNASGTSNQNNGILINLTLNCDYTDMICSNTDYSNGGFPMAMAKAVQYRAGYLLSDDILASGNINRFTMLDRERILAKRNEYASEYNTRVLWMAQNIDVSNYGCYECEPRSVFAGIKSTY